jgi:hypothetical protein
MMKRILLLLALPVFACSKTVPITEQTETLVGASGGAAKSAAGELSMAIPAGVFADGTKVIIRTDRSLAPARSVGALYELTTVPESASSAFAKPVQLTIKNTTNTGNVRIANFDGAGPVLVSGGTYDSATKIAGASLQHFSRYALTAPMECPQDPPIGVESCDSLGEQCDYGQECCCGECFASTSCTCTETGWACLANDSCLGRPPESCADGGTNECPASANPNDPCNLPEGTACTFGQECCCGECYPSLNCICSNGTFTCASTDACLGAPSQCPDAGTDDAGPQACPVTEPLPGQACSLEPQAICEYGEECCCDQCYPSRTCRCVDGRFGCLYTDACLRPPCQDPPDGG